MGKTKPRRSCPCMYIPLSLSSFTAAEYGDLHTIQNKGSKIAEVVDSAGYSPLHYSAQHGHVAATSLLLQLGCHVDGQHAKVSSGATPLHRASFAGAVSTMKILLAQESPMCDLLAKDISFGDGMTPLHKAVAGGRYLAVKLLIDVLGERMILEEGLEVKDKQGRTPWDLSVELESNGEDERRSVARWDKTAGDEPADWTRCMNILREASIENTKKQSPSAFLPAPPAYLTKDDPCADCQTDENGCCITQSWEKAFMAALSQSVSKSMDTKGDADIVRLKGSTNDSMVIASSSSLPEAQTAPPADDAATQPNMPPSGLACASCGVVRAALHLSISGQMVCKKCKRQQQHQQQQ